MFCWNEKCGRLLDINERVKQKYSRSSTWINSTYGDKVGLRVGLSVGLKVGERVLILIKSLKSNEVMRCDIWPHQHIKIIISLRTEKGLESGWDSMFWNTYGNSKDMWISEMHEWVWTCTITYIKTTYGERVGVNVLIKRELKRTPS